MKTTVEVLREARESISDEGRWQQGAYARTASGALVDPEAPEAHTLCSVGALSRAFGGRVWNTEPLEVLERAMGGKVSTFNETHSHAEVLAAFDRAIELA